MSARPPRFDPARLRAAASDGKRFWSSLEELLDEDAFRQWVAAEFPSAAALLGRPERRRMLKLMGASLLLAGLGGCGRDERSEHALPYVVQPENTLPGVARRYATAVLLEGHAQPVIATTYAGRPTKLDGNPAHPASGGASDAFMQAAVLALYDPERSQQPLHRGDPSSWSAFAALLAGERARWRERQGEGLRLLTGAVTSPTLLRQFAALAAQLPKLRWHRFEPVGSGRQDAAMQAAFGRPVEPHYRLDRAAVVVSLGDDLLGPGPRQLLHARAFAQRRGEAQPGAGRAWLHVAECVPSATGAVASTRLACDASRLAPLAAALAAQLGGGGEAPELTPAEARWAARAAEDLRTAAGRSLLVVAPWLDPAAQALAPRVNARLGNAGATVWYSEPLAPPPDSSQSLAALADDMAAGAVETLVVLDCNPVYAAPGRLDFARRLARVPLRIHAGLHADETAALCHWHLPLSHPLESFGDARAADGTATLMQPVVAPLYASRGLHQIAALLLGEEAAPDAAVRATWRAHFGAEADRRWRAALHDGFVAGTAPAPLALEARTVALPAPPAQRPAETLDVVFQPDAGVWDGRFANVAWLQELPRPLSKITWSNVIAVSPALAAARGFANGDIAELTLDGRRLHGPVWVTPGQAANTVALSFGYGRRAGGEIAAGLGYDAFAVRPDEHAFLAAGRLARVGAGAGVPTTQSHHRMDGFEFVREVTVAAPRTPPPQPTPSLYPPWPPGRPAWGMVIDLDLCIGCNACVMACNVENNVPVVGAEEVARGREMAWLRVDRYHTGSAEDPRFYFQPVPCMHCEDAPCEMGCPVHATAHSPEGVNQMVYNRCIGTRTCSSYCPYKVRRFNWYDYRRLDEAARAAQNPDVSVRSRGVMEKCTYCTQRIEAAHVAADKENRPLRRDEVVTACQQACPTQAIVFGDLSDEGSAVAARRRSGRHYVLLEEVGTRPRTTYLARWNDAPEDGS